jgi:hypothetical protein
MDRLLAIALVVVAGCSPSGPTRFVGGTAVLSAVSSDQKYVAILANPTRLSTGGHIGELEAVPTSGQVPTTLDKAAAAATYNRGNALWYLGGVTVVDEGTPVVSHVYGALYVWTPTLGLPIKIGDNVRDFTVSQNGATAVFMDWTDRNDAATNTGTLGVVTLASCGQDQCEKFAVASNVTAAQTGWHVSSDGQYVLAAVRGAAATDPGRVMLLEPGTGGMQTLSTGVDPRSPMLQPTGETAAWAEGANEIHVVGTATPTAAATVLTPSSPIVDSATMVDAATFVVKTREIAAGTPSLQRLTAAGAAMLTLSGKPVDYFVSQAVPGKTDSYLFYSTTTAAATGEHDLWLLDMATPAAQPVMLATAVDNPIAGAVSFSDDGGMIGYFDNFDPATRRGDEYVVPLAMPTRTLVALGVHSAAFEPGTRRLLYVAAPDPATGAGVLTMLPDPTAASEVQDVGVVNFVGTRMGPGRTWYTVQSGNSSDGVYYMPQP